MPRMVGGPKQRGSQNIFKDLRWNVSQMDVEFTTHSVITEVEGLLE